VNGVHDMGGAHGFGAVLREADEPVFHAPWEGRAFALTMAMGATGEWSLDEARFARESRPPVEYLSSGYYEIWLAGLERLLVERGLVAPDELAAGRSLRPAVPAPRVLTAADVAAARERGGPTTRTPAHPARFRAGDRVRARTINPATHTRLPRYVRGRLGTVTRVLGCHVFPDSNAHRLGEDPQWLYTVCFDGRELWGEDADPTTSVSVDAFEPYLAGVRRDPCLLPAE
jgi:nitrile hydratase beta subunit